MNLNPAGGPSIRIGADELPMSGDPMLWGPAWHLLEAGRARQRMMGYDKNVNALAKVLTYFASKEPKRPNRGQRTPTSLSRP